MTYLELLERADYLLEKGEITIGEWEDMIAPLRKDIAPHGDLIYRQDALDALGEEPEVWFDESYEIAQRDQWRMDRNAIESVSEWCGWIPCSERLPEEEGSYLVTDDAGGIKTVQDDEFLHYEDGTPLWLYSQNVTAWMPLSDPYGGEQNDTD